MHAHLVVTNLKTQESNMHGNMKKQLPFIYTEKAYRLSKYSYFTSMKAIKNMESSSNWIWLHSLAYFLKGYTRTENVFCHHRDVMIKAPLNQLQRYEGIYICFSGWFQEFVLHWCSYDPLVCTLMHWIWLFIQICHQECTIDENDTFG